MKLSKVVLCVCPPKSKEPPLTLSEPDGSVVPESDSKPFETVVPPVYVSEPLSVISPEPALTKDKPTAPPFLMPPLKLLDALGLNVKITAVDDPFSTKAPTVPLSSDESVKLLPNICNTESEAAKLTRPLPKAAELPSFTVPPITCKVPA